MFLLLSGVQSTLCCILQCIWTKDGPGSAPSAKDSKDEGGSEFQILSLKWLPFFCPYVAICNLKALKLRSWRKWVAWRSRWRTWPTALQFRPKIRCQTKKKPRESSALFFVFSRDSPSAICVFSHTLPKKSCQVAAHRRPSSLQHWKTSSTNAVAACEMTGLGNRARRQVAKHLRL